MPASKTLVRVFLLASIIYFGIKAIKVETEGTEAGLLSGFDQLPFVTLGILLMGEIAVGYTAYKSVHNVLQFLPALISTVLLSFCIYKKMEHESIETSATLLKLSNTAGAANAWTFEFKEDNNFKLIEFNRLGQVYYYGKYSRNNNEVNILQSNYNGFNQSLPVKGRLVADTFYWDNNDTMIVEK